ncbi:MAG: peptidase T [Candidatus Eisenbacteria bacterium]|nr:peptidase T [Candidatus Eisenbacteria bacterium]
MKTETLLDRFCRYVAVETTSNDDSPTYPTTPGQRELGEQLAGEMRALGLSSVSQDENGIVIGTLPATRSEAPAIAWVAHMDTSPEASGKDVRPIVHAGYDGGDIVLPGDPEKALRPAETPVLQKMRGKTLITSDGTTLLGADDKAGIAVILTAAERLLADRTIPHGEIRIVFTCDEEVGRGVDKLDPSRLGAVAAYTLDGEDAGAIENETFSADLATITIRGVNIHPGLATGRMVNAIRIAGQLLSRLPWQRLAPETTSGREAFLHPYSIEGGVGELTLKVLLRSFESGDLERQAGFLEQIAAPLRAEHPKASIDIAVKRQYRNMREAQEKEPRAVQLAIEAMRRAGLEPSLEAIRGGTDGARLSELGLPTPNLGTGMHNFHSPLEFACLEEMEQTVEALVHLARLWGEERRGEERRGEERRSETRRS